MRIVRTLTVAPLAFSLWSAAPAVAQPLGSFRWQLQPHCNVITVQVVQQGSQYQLHGTDDQCGSAVSAAVVGLAFLNPNGTIGFGLTIVSAPGGTTVAVDATISMTTLDGTWRDSAGNSGTLVFTPGAGLPGSPRPIPVGGLPPGSVTTVQIAPAAVTSTRIAANAVTGAHVADGSITTSDLQGAPKAAFLSSEQTVTLTPAAAVIRSVTLTIPVAGKVVATATATAGFLSTSTNVEFVQCALSSSPAMDLTHQVVAGDGGSTASSTYSAMAVTRGFDVTPGNFTVHFVCQEFSGNTEIRNSSLTAAFIGS